MAWVGWIDGEAMPQVDGDCGCLVCASSINMAAFGGAIWALDVPKPAVVRFSCHSVLMAGAKEI